MTNKNAVRIRVLIVCLLVLPACFVAIRQVAEAKSIPQVISKNTLPASVGAWEGQDIDLTSDELSILSSPAASQKIYSNSATGDQVQVLLLQVDNTQNAHDPRLCMAGSGFQNVSDKRVRVDWADPSRPRSEVSETLFAKDQVRVPMYYWMQTSKETIADMSAGLKWEGIKRALRGEPTKAIAVRVIALQNRFDQNRPSDVRGAIELWKNVDATVRLDKLVNQL